MTDMEFIKTKTSKSDPVVKKGKQTSNFFVERNSRVSEEKRDAYPKSFGISLSEILDGLVKQIGILTNFLQDSQLLTDNPRMLLIPDKNGCEFINEDELLCCKGEGNYARLYLKDATTRVVTKRLGEVAELLDSSLFLKTHQSWVVKKREIFRINHDGNSITTKCGMKVPIARSMMTTVKAELGWK